MDGTCLLMINLSSCYRLLLWKYCSNLSFLNYCMLNVLSASTSKKAATDSVQSVNLSAAILDSRCRCTLGQSLTHSQSDEKAVIWTLKDSFPAKCTDYVAETWRELFRFITATMMRGLRRANTGT